MGAPPKQDGVGDYIVIWCILSRCQGDLFSGVNLLVVSTLVMILQELGHIGIDSESRAGVFLGVGV